ncbi:FxLD family lantipeptide [Actinopolyspora alba]|uniref:FxLD family lantipeptide n=1 Tax=Actinopolyspora alba TaxID=673379 RepID=A0A1I2C681_9ACTN|nr:FxLD family lanthipeptide [Actinopolyspora alba]SFE63797.1 FxLD family lantipeptide [Actinopolyspora alba]
MSTPTTLESSSTEPDSDFDLDVTVVAAAEVAELRSPTEDNCGQTCESACPQTGC